MKKLGKLLENFDNEQITNTVAAVDAVQNKLIDINKDITAIVADLAKNGLDDIAKALSEINIRLDKLDDIKDAINKLINN